MTDPEPVVYLCKRQFWCNPMIHNDYSKTCLLVINLKTAKGELPASVLARADEVVSASEMHLMQAANYCHSLRTGDAMQRIEHARARAGIEAGYRLTGENERFRNFLLQMKI